jgi:predicted dinucleotide-utilizing enzyme
MEQELKKYRDQEENTKKKQQQEQEQRLDQHYTEHYDKIISDGLSKSGLPRTAATIKSVAKYLDRALDAGLDVTVDDVIPFVKQDYLNTIQELFGASDGDTLLSLLGGNADKIRKADLARLRGMQSSEPKPMSKQEPAPSRDEKPKYIDKYEAAENVRRKLGLK